MEMHRAVASIKHIGIYVKNLEKMRVFYRDVLGFIELECYHDSGEHLEHVFQVKGIELNICKLVSSMGKENGSGDMIELIEYAGCNEEITGKMLYSPGLSHIALGVSDINLTCQLIAQSGAQEVCKPIKVKDSNNYLAFYRDPEGNYLELIQKGE